LEHSLHWRPALRVEHRPGGGARARPWQAGRHVHAPSTRALGRHTHVCACTCLLLCRVRSQCLELLRVYGDVKYFKLMTHKLSGASRVRRDVWQAIPAGAAVACSCCC
jgi:hypothetical protein